MVQPFHSGANFYPGSLDFDATNLNPPKCSPPVRHFQEVCEIIDILQMFLNPTTL